MALAQDRRLQLPGWLFLVLAAVVGFLYLAREVLIPLALAILFSFLLAPAVRRLEQWHIGRALGSVLVVVLLVLVLGAVAWFAGDQAINLVGKLPEYKENIAQK